MNYFEQTGYVSNSDLGSVSSKGSWVRDLTPYYNFGTLIDALFTEPEKVDHEKRTVGPLVFDEETFQLALDMHRDGMADPMLSKFIKVMDKQFEKYVDEFEIEYEGEKFTLPVRIKADFYKVVMRMGGDLKSTASATLNAMLSTIKELDYDRQAAWYMDIGDLDTFVIIAISKKKDKEGKHKVFRLAIQRGDQWYLSGKAKYTELAWRYKQIHKSKQYDLPDF